MTTTTARWWAPGGPIGAEEMLRPGTDPQKDIGLALFALHRAGAEACELVAKTAVADESVLIAALAETRALMAPLAVETIAKGVGGPQYAGLLLRDVLDDAEVAALALYRTCLAKSVAPPIAAERVGMVYGVPSRDLSRYSAIASDPKSNPRAVADLADRTLFDYVSKIVTEEYAPAKESFSKAPGDYEDQHNVSHDQAGRFVRERANDGIDLNDLFRRAEERQAAEQTAEPEVGRRAEPRRLQRHSRMQRTSRSTKPTEVGQQTVGPRMVSRQMVGPRQMTRQQVSVQRLIERDEPAPMPLLGLGYDRPPDLSQHGDPQTSATIDEPVSFILPNAKYQALAHAAADAPGKHVFYADGLIKYAGEARLVLGKDGVHQSHVAGLEGAVHTLESAATMRLREQLGNDAQPQAIIEHVIDNSALAADDLGSSVLKLHAAKSKFLEGLKRDMGLKINVANEVGNVRMGLHPHDKDKSVLVYRPPSYDRMGRQGDPVPIAHVAELVVDPKAARGTVERGRVKMDGSSTLAISTLVTEAGTSASRKTVWDPNLQALRTIVIVEAASPTDMANARWPKRFGKATDYEDQHNVSHDERGRFVRERTTTDLQHLFDTAQQRHGERRMAAPTTPRRLARLNRTTRSTTPTPVARQSVGPRQVGQQNLGARTVARQQLLARQVKAANKIAEQHAEELVYFDDEQPYTPLSAQTMGTLLHHLRVPGFAEDVGRTVVLDGPTRDLLMRQRSVKGDETRLNVHQLAVDAWNADIASSAAPSERRVLKVDISDASDLWAAAAHLGDLMRQDQKLTMLRVEFRRNDLNSEKAQLQVFANTKEQPVQHVLRYSDEAVPDQPRALVPGTTKRMQNAYTLESWLHQTYASMKEFKTPGAEDVIADPHVKTWTVE